MNFFYISLLLNIKKLIGKKAIIAGFILLPIIIAVYSAIVSSNEPVIVVRAGVFYGEESPLKTAIFEYLLENNTPFIQFVAYDNPHTLKQDIRQGIIDSGYILTPQVYNALYGDFFEIINVVTSAASVATPILNDIVAAALLRATVQDITLNGLEGAFGASDELSNFVTSQFDAYRQMDIFMIPFFTGEEGAEANTDNNTLRIFHGFIGLIILILSLFGAPMFIKERQGGLSTALQAHGKLVIYDVSILAAAFIILFATGLIGLIAVNIFMPLIYAVLPIASLALYAAISSFLLVLMAKFLKSTAFIQSFGIFIVILNIFFGGVLINITELSPTLGQIQWLFPLFWYIEMAL